MMNLLGDLLGAPLGDIDQATPPAEEPPYEQPYIPPHQFTPPEITPPWEDIGITPLRRPDLPPLIPLTETRAITPPMPGPRYVQGPIGKITPATHSPYPPPRLISDNAIVKILVSKNTYEALRERGLPTMAMRRRLLDENTQRLVESDVLQRTLEDIERIQRGDYTSIAASQLWQYEAVKYKLVDAAELRNLMSRIVPIQSWLLKEQVIIPPNF